MAPLLSDTAGHELVKGEGESRGNRIDKGPRSTGPLESDIPPISLNHKWNPLILAHRTISVYRIYMHMHATTPCTILLLSAMTSLGPYKNNGTYTHCPGGTIVKSGESGGKDVVEVPCGAGCSCNVSPALHDWKCECTEVCTHCDCHKLKPATSRG